MKLGIVTAFHGRESLTRMWCEHTQQFGVPMYCAITEGGPTFSAKNFVIMRNNPVGAKFDAALSLAMSDDCDAVMILPSDDFISQEWVDVSIEALALDAVYFKPARMAVHQPGRGSYELRSDGKSCGNYGAGRVVHRSVIEAVGELWPGGRDQGLDSESHGRIRGAGFECTAITTKGIPLVDIKCGENIHSWDSFRGSGHRCTDEQALHMMTTEQVQCLSIPG
jgi:hypothetical protein